MDVKPDLKCSSESPFCSKAAFISTHGCIKTFGHELSDRQKENAMNKDVQQQKYQAMVNLFEHRKFEHFKKTGIRHPWSTWEMNCILWGPSSSYICTGYRNLLYVQASAAYLPNSPGYVLVKGNRWVTDVSLLWLVIIHVHGIANTFSSLFAIPAGG